MTVKFTTLETGFSILKCGEHYNLNYPVFKDGQEYREYKPFETFQEAFLFYEAIKHESTN